MHQVQLPAVFSQCPLCSQKLGSSALTVLCLPHVLLPWTFRLGHIRQRHFAVSSSHWAAIQLQKEPIRQLQCQPLSSKPPGDYCYQLHFGGSGNKQLLQWKGSHTQCRCRYPMVLVSSIHGSALHNNQCSHHNILQLQDRDRVLHKDGQRGSDN